MNLSEIFTYADTTYRLSIEQEVEAILGAQAGDPDATEALLRQYGPTIRATVNRAKKTVDEDEAQSVALLAFAEVLESHDVESGDYADPRLASRLTPHLKDRLGEIQAQESSGFSVPKRTYTRFYGILNEAGGDVATALALAPEKGMSQEVFGQVLTAVRETLSIQDVLRGEDGDDEGDRILANPIEATASSSFTEVEDRLLVEVAFQSVEDDEARICELFYGFTEYEPVPDGEIAHRLGLTRPAVQRRRGKALDKMSKATGVLQDEEGGK